MSPERSPIFKLLEERLIRLKVHYNKRIQNFKLQYKVDCLDIDKIKDVFTC